MTVLNAGAIVECMDVREGLGLPASGPTFELAADLPSVDSMTVNVQAAGKPRPLRATIFLRISDVPPRRV